MQYEMPKITPDFNTLSPLVQGYTFVLVEKI